VRWYPGRDGERLAWRETGSGRPLVLLHGLFASGALTADTDLVRVIAGQGYRVILPDLRGHGDSAGPHDRDLYPPDVVIDDVLALIDHLGLDDYALGGYSVGGKLVLRVLARGARPARAFVGGQGLDALGSESSRTDGYRRVLSGLVSGEPFAPGSDADRMAGWITSAGVDPLAVRYVLDSFMATSEDELRQVLVPTLIVVGDQDIRAATADKLAALLPNGRLALVPGDHGSVLTGPELPAAVLAFLGEGR
jgi:pimeloyl-ACP methyl ester carboxylesterase